MANLNIKNRTIFCHDNLEVLQNINDECIDLVYLDPPFNKRNMFTAPTKRSARKSKFKDMLREEDFKDEWVKEFEEDQDHHDLYGFLEGVKNMEGGQKSDIYCYLCYMAIRLIEIRRILKDTGSIYLHCDSAISHYLKLLLDRIFGETRFVNEILWKKHDAKTIPNYSYDTITDRIFIYAKRKTKVHFNLQYEPLSIKEMEKEFLHTEEETGRRYKFISLYKSSTPSSSGEIRKIQGKTITTKFGWRWSQKTFNERIKDNPYLIHWTKAGRPYYKRYSDEDHGKPLGDIWEIPSLNPKSNEYLGYSTQKPLALLERIIKTSSNKDGVVLDPFCGLATTCEAAEELGRQWVGIDITEEAYKSARKRLNKVKINHLTYLPKRRKSPPKKKFVYVVSNPLFSGLYKVGVTMNLEVRLNVFQTSGPFRGFKIEYSKLTPRFREIEKYVLNKYQADYEWIKADLNDIIQDIETYKPKRKNTTEKAKNKN